MPAHNTSAYPGTGKAASRTRLRRYSSAGIVLACVAAVIGILTLVTTKDRTAPPQEPPPVNVEVLRIRPVDEVADTFELDADVEPNRVVDVSAEVAGRIEDIPCKEGTECKEGDTLIVLNADLIKAEYDKAEQEEKFDALEYERVKASQEKNVATKLEYAQAESKHEISKALLSAAKTRLERTKIKAPISGILNRIPGEEGNYVNVGEKVAEIVDTSTFKIVVQVPERDIRYIKTRDTATVILNERIAEEDREEGDDAVTAEITYVDAQADELARTTRVEITLQNRVYKLSNGEARRLHDRDIVRVRLTRGKYDNVILIPLKAVIPEENDRVVYVVNSGQARRVGNINLGFFKGDQVTIRNSPKNGSSPLKEGDLLIVAGQQFVGPGQNVVVRKIYEGTGVK
jgi:RND family efflux transporter MFP subunit